MSIIKKKKKQRRLPLWIFFGIKIPCLKIMTWLVHAFSNRVPLKTKIRKNLEKSKN